MVRTLNCGDIDDNGDETEARGKTPASLILHRTVFWDRDLEAEIL
jgi:hypothetical protein